MSVFDTSMFALVVAFHAGVVTGGMMVFFVRGPVVAFFRVKDEPADPVYVEVLSPRPRRRPWERVAVNARDAALPTSLPKQLGGGGAR